MILNKFLIAVGFSQRAGKSEEQAWPKMIAGFLAKALRFLTVVPLAEANGNDFLPY